MISESDIIKHQHGIRSDSIGNQEKNEINNSKHYDSNRVRQSSSLRQMTWVPNTSPSNNQWMSNENTFLTNVNSISTLDPVVQTYIDQQIKSEFSKLNKPYINCFNKLKEQFENHLSENRISFNNFQIFQKDFQDKFHSMESQLAILENDKEEKEKIQKENENIEEENKQIKKENEKSKKEIIEKNNIIMKLEEMFKSLKEKITLIESEQKKQETKKKELDKIKELQAQITSMNDSTVKCISHLQEKIDDCLNTITSFEEKNNNNHLLFKKEQEVKINDLKNAFESIKKGVDETINEMKSKIDRSIQNSISQEKLFDSCISKKEFLSQLDSLNSELDKKINQKIASNNQIQNDFQKELMNLKTKIEQIEKDQIKIKNSTEIINNQNCLDIDSTKIKELEMRIQELEQKVKNLVISSQELCLLPTTVSLIQERIININKEGIFIESQIKNIENDIQKIKIKLSKYDRLTLTTFQSTVDIIGNGGNGQFDLTIGEPDISIAGCKGIQLFLPKSYQDYSFNSCPTFELILKEPIEPKSNRRKQKSRKFKK